MPIDRAVEVNAARYAGSNAAARHSRGVESLTIRPLRIHRFPDEDWVTVRYQKEGDVRELTIPWLVARTSHRWSRLRDRRRTTR